MEGTGRNAESPVDASVEVLGDPGYTVPLHEGQAGALSGIEEDMIDSSALLDRESLMDQDIEPEHALVESACGPNVVGGQADAIDGQKKQAMA